MRSSRSKEGLHWFTRVRSVLPPIKPVPLEGYSLKRMLLFGLIFPAIVISSLLVGLYFAIWLRLPLVTAALMLSLWAFAGFGVGTFVMLKLTNKIMKYVKVKK